VGALAAKPTLSDHLDKQIQRPSAPQEAHGQARAGRTSRSNRAGRTSRSKPGRADQPEQPGLRDLAELPERRRSAVAYAYVEGSNR